MRAGSMNSFDKDRHLLISVDNSENAERAVSYVADFLGGVPGFRVTILNVVPEPPTDYFPTDQERNTWIEEQRSGAARMLDRFRLILVQSGFGKDKVETLLDMARCPSVADRIMEIQQRLQCCTIVVGRRGISKKEEFLFGSTSTRIIRSGKNCAVWVIE